MKTVAEAVKPFIGEYRQTPYRGHEIKPKLDFGTRPFLIEGLMIYQGFVVVFDDCNAMPGAAWFTTVSDAKEAVDILLAVGEKRFWEAWTKCRKAKQDTFRTTLATFADAGVNK